MIYKEKPSNFVPKFKVVATLVVWKNKILLLKRIPTNNQPHWGLPAGKIDPGETEQQAVQRELYEETSISLPLVAFTNPKKYYMELKDKTCFEFTAFKVDLEFEPKISFSLAEHMGAIWVKPEDVYKLDTMEDLVEFINLYFSEINNE